MITEIYWSMLKRIHVIDLVFLRLKKMLTITSCNATNKLRWWLILCSFMKNLNVSKTKTGSIYVISFTRFWNSSYTLYQLYFYISEKLLGFKMIPRKLSTSDVNRLVQVNYASIKNGQLSKIVWLIYRVKITYRASLLQIL